MKSFKFENGKLVEDPVGADVWMRYQGRELLGTVLLTFRERGNDYLNVRFFNGESWPLEPLAEEVGYLERTYDEEPFE